MSTANTKPRAARARQQPIQTQVVGRPTHVNALARLLLKLHESPVARAVGLGVRGEA